MARGFRGFRRNIIVDGFKPYENTFTFTGAMQSLNIPYTGLYKIELYGAQGGGNYGGNGGYTIGYRLANKGDIWYIGVGGRNNAFNGGGGSSGATGDGGRGGGASHVGLENAELKNTSVANILGVAGGGGGGFSLPNMYTARGGTGGGTNGGNTSGGQDGFVSYGGTQSSGGTNSMNYSWLYGSFGQGGSYSPGNWLDNRTYGGGGGGGFYGGSGGHGYNNGGGGGSGYIGGVPSLTYKGTTYSPSMSNGVNSGNGSVKITRIA